MKDNSKGIRMFHLLMGRLLEFDNTLQIDFCDGRSPYDYKLIMPTYNMSIGINLRSSSYGKSAVLRNDIQKLIKASFEDSEEQTSIIVFSINEETEQISCAIQLLWQYGHPMIFERLYLHTLTLSRWNMLIDILKASQSHISLLQEDNFSIIHKICVKWHNGTRICRGVIVYLRRFTTAYKMHPIERTTDEAKMDLYIYGYKEQEFPKDFLDLSILKEISNMYDVETITKDVFLFNVDALNLQSIRQQNCAKIHFCFSPDLQVLPYINFSMPMELPFVEIELFSNEQIEGNTLKGQLSLDDFKACGQLVETFSCLSDYFV